MGLNNCKKTVIIMTNFILENILFVMLYFEQMSVEYLARMWTTITLILCVIDMDDDKLAAIICYK